MIRLRGTAAALLLFLAACTGAPPQIVTLEASLEYVDDFDFDVRYEQLTIFALVRDEDGFSDIRHFYLIHDEAELFWRLEPDGWMHRRTAGEDWIGFSGVTMADWSELPRGRYRLVVVDGSGERDERVVSIDAPLFSAVQHRLPRFNRAERSLTISGTPALLRFVTGDDEEAADDERVIPVGDYRISELLRDAGGSDGDSTAYLYVELGPSYGSLSGPIRP